MFTVNTVRGRGSHENVHKVKFTVILIHGPTNVFNESLQYVLARELRVPCQVIDDIGSARGASDDSEVDRPVVLLLDGSDGRHDLTFAGSNADLRALPPEIVLAVYNLPRGMRIRAEALRKGLRGIFFAEDNLTIVLKGLRALMNGDVWLSHSILLDLVLDKAGDSLAEIADASGLTRREIEILAHVSRGETNDEISESLCISSHTIKTHLYNIYRKIGVNNRFQASLWAVKHLR